MMNKLLMKEQIEINENGSYFIELSTNLKDSLKVVRSVTTRKRFSLGMTMSVSTYC